MNMMNKAKKFLKIIQLKNKQKYINKEFEREGLSDRVLMEQIEINKMRHVLDIADCDNFIFEKFVQ